VRELPNLLVLKVAGICLAIPSKLPMKYIHSLQKHPYKCDAYPHQKRYGKDMRVRVSESTVIPSLSRNADGSVILNISAELSFEDIEEFIGDQFLPGEKDQAYSLWANDESKRLKLPTCS
jgi:hypothetical protein